ncbi:MCM family protein [Methanoculleus sp. FWC-SCC1]|uniref:MCM family protein n=1 Tax=Methanoculleus frigidifontis TaxID=2584085 RepID=A0ABT8M6K8_9EURY|nr:LAGLIDADG family homing endonuclease [Methanoculleus sp. FWC-SCC1]MDN7023576.1 MCM family protein [Methanoculleus sp. FWC-SCC1]
MPEEVEVEVTDVVTEWTKFLKKRYKRELAELAREYPHKRSLSIDYRTILNNTLAFELLKRPGKVIGDIRDAIVQNRLIKLKNGQEPTGISIRFTNLPQKVNVRDIRAEQINTFVSIEGILRKTTEVRPRLVDAVFRCKSCNKNTDPIPQNYSRFEEPDFCPHCERKSRMDLVLNRCIFVDAQKLRIQESPEGLRGGEQPQTLDIDATDDLTGMVAPGDRIVVNGILRSIQRVNYGQKSTLFDIYLECNSIEVAEKEFEEVSISEEDEAAIKGLARDGAIYKKIARSIAPTIYGTDDVKEAIALQLFGGIAKEMPDGSRLRGDIHLLLVGDPGIAKSQILRYVVKLSPRGIYTSGKSSTSAGLTATAVKDEFGDGRWTLEAGALVLADMGIAAVDEMDKMAKEDRSALHEAMEQQCYDDETEVLTERGWKLFRDVTADDRVATLSPDGRLEYASPSGFTASEYDGELYYVKSRQVDLAVTPNHRMYVNLNRRADEWEGFRFIRMDEIPVHKRMRFKRNAVWTGKRQEIYEIPPVVKFANQNAEGRLTDPIHIGMDDWLEFLGYFLSEGSVQRHYQTAVPYRVVLSQTIPESAEKIRQCLERLPFRFSYDGKNFAINAKQLAEHLAPFGKCHEKYVPDYAKRLPPKQIGVLLDALMLGDGYVHKTTGVSVYTTSSKRLADDVTELLLKKGWSGNARIMREAGTVASNPRGGTSTASHDTYQVTFIRDGQNEPNINTNGQRHIERRPYRGMIYCLEVPNHMLYVRRSGIPVWCGNSISVAKAGITATLKSRCALLGAANPKLGRFDQFVPIAEQINMPPSLLSRFDLIFVMTDQPEVQRDGAIANHIVKTHAVGELIKQHAYEPLPDVDEAYIQRALAPVIPDIDPTLLRKYIAYAKRTCFPILSDGAKEALIQYYMKLRNLASGNKPVPVTARQLEALVRLAEASARMRLANTVDTTDTDRVLRIVDTCLRQVAYDAESGSFDIDKLVTGVSKSQRDIIRTVKEVIRDLAKDGGGQAKADQVVETLIQQGFARDKIENAIEQLRRGGEVLEPRHGFLKVIG